MSDEILDELTQVLTELLRRVLREEEIEQIFARTPLTHTKAYDQLKQQLLSVYEFEVISTPLDSDWSRRAQEEVKAFVKFKTSEYGDLLPHFLMLTPSMRNRQIFFTRFVRRDGRRVWCQIRLPNDYPFSPPHAILSSDGSLEVYTVHTDPNKCLGELVRRRWSPHMGIAHWLVLVEILLQIIHASVRLR